MTGQVIRSQVLKSKELILHEAREMSGFMDLLMKERNTGGGWDRAERVQLRRYLARLALYIPILLVFLLPGGFVLIPLLAEVLDRRMHLRPPAPEGSAKVPEPTVNP
jgi:hypothetical protein